MFQIKAWTCLTLAFLVALGNMETQRGNTKGTQLIVSEFWVVLLSGVCA